MNIVCHVSYIIGNAKTNRGDIQWVEEVTIPRIVPTDMSKYHFIGTNDKHNFGQYYAL